MHRTNAQSTIVPDALAIIAACSESRSLMELAVALRAVVSGTVLLPPDRVETISRIATDLMNPRWNVEAHVTLMDQRVQYFASAFCRACVQAVPLTAENPTRDLVWQARVKATLEWDMSLQNHAKLLLQHIRLRVTPAQRAVAPAVAANAVPPKRDKAELHTKAKRFAEEFVRRWKAQKACAAAVSVSAPIPAAEPEPRQIPAAPAIVAPASTPLNSDVMRVMVPWTRYSAAPASPIVPAGHGEARVPVFPRASTLRRFLTPPSWSPPV